jgi:hypothetical protein
MAAVAITALTSASPLAAQGVRFGVGGGPTFVLEDGGGASFHAMGTVAFAGRDDLPVSFRLDGQYQLGDDVDVLSGTGNAVYAFSVSGDTKFRPYLIGGLGIYNINPDAEGFDSETSSASTPARASMSRSGKAIPALRRSAVHNIFTEGENLNLLPITVGIMFGGS